MAEFCHRESFPHKDYDELKYLWMVWVKSGFLVTTNGHPKEVSPRQAKQIAEEDASLDPYYQRYVGRVRFVKPVRTTWIWTDTE